MALNLAITSVLVLIVLVMGYMRVRAQSKLAATVSEIEGSHQHFSNLLSELEDIVAEDEEQENPRPPEIWADTNLFWSELEATSRRPDILLVLDNISETHRVNMASWGKYLVSSKQDLLLISRLSDFHPASAEAVWEEEDRLERTLEGAPAW